MEQWIVLFWEGLMRVRLMLRSLLCLAVLFWVNLCVHASAREEEGVRPGSSVEGAGPVRIHLIPCQKTPHSACSDDPHPLDAFRASPVTFVVRGRDLQTQKEALASFLGTRADHHVELLLDDETFAPEGVLSLSKDDLPNNLRTLLLVDATKQITRIANDFLVDCLTLVCLRMKGFTRLKSIDDNFLAGCKGLQIFHTGELAKLTTIRDNFLLGCTGLESFNPDGLRSLKSIGDLFLASSGLKVFNTMGMEGLISIGRYFCNECVAFTRFDARGLRSVKRIDDYCLYNCRALVRAQLGGLRRLKYKGDYFLGDCPHLQVDKPSVLCSVIQRNRQK